ncbi:MULTISPECIES: TetR/AcrR family transcriptional regulator [Marinobacter]|jgi:AcrR family transcriptional regulator|uniref:TetR family transcriptional regulator n=1 Tax=Marinobacter nauticus TaxID=2743 RepID=A0A368XY40_MARNT|nr:MULTISPECIES: TetR/AcrR family transcriptional regulator [Marinobacter]ERS81349.1 TetR family transcriptional regulator [Marinobacter sp. EVN1]MBN8237936.1 TetR/AcrR family transcriptional regulator [Marinobacter nauticus]MBY6221233.1 TetR/AcrR family transcriptional regulator [Marinobacter nauticus]RCW72056.1 TetR family transcriptional regulator [Marinobacter nauticus]CCG94987.1 putative Transcriptional regulator, TetR family [Marinobacter nauticus ATCC 49840]
MDMLKLTSPQATGKRALNRIRNRHAILRAARDCFQEHGYDNTTIRDIVRRTGLAAGTFYNYFSSKQDIFAALLSDFLTSLNNDMSKQRQSASSTQEFVYRAYLALYSATAKDPVVYELAHQNQRALRNLFGSDILGLTMLSLEEDVRNAMTRGLLPAVDADYLCAAFFGVAYDTSMLVARRAHQKPELAQDEARTAAEFSTQLFLGGFPALTRLSSEG